MKKSSFLAIISLFIFTILTQCSDGNKISKRKRNYREITHSSNNQEKLDSIKNEKQKNKQR
ncbi:MAG: hypothetical protein RLZZ531_1039 [Bacteroidota bacterium]|jgi:hypothetical protein